MSPEYLKELADIADPEKLWMLSGIEQLDLPKEKRAQLDTGIALRRYAVDIEDQIKALKLNKSILVTPLSPNGRAKKMVDTPIEHKRLKGE